MIMLLSWLSPEVSWAFIPKARPSLDPKVVTVPKALGTVVSRHLGTGPLIIQVQDLHGQEEVQRHIAGLVRYLAKHQGVRLVGVEGAWDYLDLSPLRGLVNPVIRQSIADYLLQQGLITGAEYGATLNPTPLMVKGFEDKALYEANLQQARTLLTTETLGYFQDLKEALQNQFAPGGSNAKSSVLKPWQQRLDVLERVLTISATPQDVATFLAHPHWFNIKACLHLLPRAVQTSWLVNNDPVFLDNKLKVARTFYATAHQRSRVFADHWARTMAEEKQNVAVVVTGGFHTQDFLQALQAHGFSTISIIPSLTRPEAANPYFGLLTQRATALASYLDKHPASLSLLTRFYQGPKTSMPGSHTLTREQERFQEMIRFLVHLLTMAGQNQSELWRMARLTLPDGQRRLVVFQANPVKDLPSVLKPEMVLRLGHLKIWIYQASAEEVQRAWKGVRPAMERAFSWRPLGKTAKKGVKALAVKAWGSRRLLMTGAAAVVLGYTIKAVMDHDFTTLIPGLLGMMTSSGSEPQPDWVPRWKKDVQTLNLQDVSMHDRRWQSFQKKLQQADWRIKRRLAYWMIDRCPRLFGPWFQQYFNLQLPRADKSTLLKSLLVAAAPSQQVYIGSLHRYFGLTLSDQPQLLAEVTEAWLNRPFKRGTVPWSINPKDLPFFNHYLVRQAQRRPLESLDDFIQMRSRLENWFGDDYNLLFYKLLTAWLAYTPEDQNHELDQNLKMLQRMAAPGDLFFQKVRAEGRPTPLRWVGLMVETLAKEPDLLDPEAAARLAQLNQERLGVRRLADYHLLAWKLALLLDTRQGLTAPQGKGLMELSDQLYRLVMAETKKQPLKSLQILSACHGLLLEQIRAHPSSLEGPPVLTSLDQWIWSLASGQDDDLKQALALWFSPPGVMAHEAGRLRQFILTLQYYGVEQEKQHQILTAIVQGLEQRAQKPETVKPFLEHALANILLNVILPTTSLINGEQKLELQQMSLESLLDPQKGPLWQQLGLNNREAIKALAGLPGVEEAMRPLVLARFAAKSADRKALERTIRHYLEKHYALQDFDPDLNGLANVFNPWQHFVVNKMRGSIYDFYLMKSKPVRWKRLSDKNRGAFVGRMVLTLDKALGQMVLQPLSKGDVVPAGFTFTAMNFLRTKIMTDKTYATLRIDRVMFPAIKALLNRYFKYFTVMQGNHTLLSAEQLDRVSFQALAGNSVVAHPKSLEEVVTDQLHEMERLRTTVLEETYLIQGQDLSLVRTLGDHLAKVVWRSTHDTKKTALAGILPVVIADMGRAGKAQYLNHNQDLRQLLQNDYFKPLCEAEWLGPDDMDWILRFLNPSEKDVGIPSWVKAILKGPSSMQGMVTFSGLTLLLAVGAAGHLALAVMNGHWQGPGLAAAVMISSLGLTWLIELMKNWINHSLTTANMNKTRFFTPLILLLEKIRSIILPARPPIPGHPRRRLRGPFQAA